MATHEYMSKLCVTADGEIKRSWLRCFSAQFCSIYEFVRMYLDMQWIQNVRGIWTSRSFYSACILVIVRVERAAWRQVIVRGTRTRWEQKIRDRQGWGYSPPRKEKTGCINFAAGGITEKHKYMGNRSFPYYIQSRHSPLLVWNHRPLPVWHIDDLSFVIVLLCFTFKKLLFLS